jgi:anti-sigma28 factor (negative regulator of flagellin synthesis)
MAGGITMQNRLRIPILIVMLGLILTACSPKIYGRVRLVDKEMHELKDESPKGTVINMINTTAKVEKASTSVLVDEKGKFESAKESIQPGTYKVEASRIGFGTQTHTVEIGGSTHKKLKFDLQKIDEGNRKSIGGASTDEDKIVNPGEVNIQPPGM